MANEEPKKTAPAPKQEKQKRDRTVMVNKVRNPDTGELTTADKIKIPVTKTPSRREKPSG